MEVPSVTLLGDKQVNSVLETKVAGTELEPNLHINFDLGESSKLVPDMVTLVLPSVLPKMGAMDSNDTPTE